MEAEALEVSRLEDQVVAERHLLAQEPHLSAHRVAAGDELPLLVILPIIRQVGLGHQPQDPPAINHHRAVEQLLFERHRRADHQHRPQRRARLDQLPDRLPARVQQRVLVEQIIIGVGRNPQLREQGHRHVCFGGLPRQGQGAFEVEGGVGYAQRRQAHRCPYHPMRINRVKTLTHGL